MATNLLEHLNGATPLVLLPARIETRWDMRDSTDPKLLIRIYPDEICVSGHQSGLSADEISAGEAWWAAGHNDAAWPELVAKLGAPRAAWVARRFFELRKDNPSAVVPQRSAVEPARARELPQRYVAVVYVSSPAADRPPSTFNVTGASLSSSSLQVSPTREPTAAEGFVEPELQWLTDFDVAVRKGMGIRVERATLSSDEQSVFSRAVTVGLERLLVVGVPRARTPSQFRTDLRDLLELHHYADGLAVVPPGTSTNGTSLGASGYASTASVPGTFTHEKSLGGGLRGRSDAVWKCGSDALVPRRWTTAGARALQGLGLVPPPPASGWSHTSTWKDERWKPVSNLASQSASYSEITPAEAMRILLFPALLGAVLRVRSGLAREDLISTWMHFARHVAPEGHWPTIRRGAVPYAVLPVSAVPTEASVNTPASPGQGWVSSSAETPTGLERTLYQLLRRWREAAKKLVWNGQKGDDQETIAKILSREPFSRASGVPSEIPVLFWGRGSSARVQRMILRDSLKGLSAGKEWVTIVNDGYATWRSVAGDDELCAWSGEVPTAIPTSWTYASGVDRETYRARFNELGQSGLSATVRAGKVHSLNQWSLTIFLDDLLRTPLSSAKTRDVSESLSLLDDTAGAEWFLAPYLEWSLLKEKESTGYVSNPAVSADATDFAASQDAVTLNALKGSGLVANLTFSEVGTVAGYKAGAVASLLGASEPSWFSVLAVQSCLDALRMLQSSGSDTTGPNFPGDAPSAELARSTWNLWKRAAACLADTRAVPAATRERLMFETMDACCHRLDAWITSLAHRRLEWLDQRKSDAEPSSTANRYLGAYAWVHDIPAAPTVSASQSGAGGFIHAPSLNAAMAAAVLRSAALDPDDQDQPFAIDLDSRRARQARALLTGVRNGVPLSVLLGQRLERALARASLEHWTAPFRRAFPLQKLEADDDPETDLSPVVDGLAVARFWRDRSSDGVLGSSANTAWPELKVLYNGDYKNKKTGLTEALTDVASALDAVADLMMAEGIYQAVLGNSDRAAASLAAMDGEGDPPDPQILRSPRAGSPLGFEVLLNLGVSDGPGEAGPTPWWAPATPRALAEPRMNRWLAEWLKASPVGENPRGYHAMDLLAVATRARSAGGSALMEEALGVSAAAAGQILDRLLPVVDMLDTARPVKVEDLKRSGLSSVTEINIDGRLDQVRARLPAATETLTVAHRIQWGLEGDSEARWREELAARDAKSREDGLSTLERLRALLGEDAIIVPPVQVSGSSALTTVSPAAREVRVWVGQAARVHEGLERWWMMRLQEGGETLRVMQTAFAATDPAPAAGYDRTRWIGLGLPAGLSDSVRDAQIEGLAGARSVVVDGPALVDGELAALRVDGWIERIPLANAITGLSFHYDDAGAEAPQAILVAVPADVTSPTWTLDGLLQVLNDTLQLAKIRGVSPEELAVLGQLVSPLTLPATSGLLLVGAGPNLQLPGGGNIR